MPDLMCPTTKGCLLLSMGVTRGCLNPFSFWWLFPTCSSLTYIILTFTEINTGTRSSTPLSSSKKFKCSKNLFPPFSKTSSFPRESLLSSSLNERSDWTEPSVSPSLAEFWMWGTRKWGLWCRLATRTRHAASTLGRCKVWSTGTGWWICRFREGRRKRGLNKVRERLGDRQAI